MLGRGRSGRAGLVSPIPYNPIPYPLSLLPYLRDPAALVREKKMFRVDVRVRKPLDMIPADAMNGDVTRAQVVRLARQEGVRASFIGSRRIIDRGLWKSRPGSSSRGRNCDATTGS